MTERAQATLNPAQKDLEFVMVLFSPTEISPYFLTSVWTFLSVFSAESFLSISSFELNDCPASGPR